MRKFRNCFAYLMRLMHPLRWKIALSVFNGLVLVAVSLGFVWMSKRVVDIATGQLDASLERSVVLFVGIMLLQIFCRTFARYWESYMVVNFQNSTRLSVFDHVLRSTWDGKDRFHSGDTVNRLEEDIRVICDFTCVNMPELLITAVQMVAATVFLFRMSPDLAWILVWIMPVAVIGSRLFFRKMRQLTNEIRSADSKVQGQMQENIQHKILVRTMGSTDEVVDELDSIQGYVRSKTITRMNYSAVSRFFMQLGFASGYALAFLWGVFGLRDGTVTYGLMVGFLQLVGQVQRPVADFTRQVPAFIRALSSTDRIMDLTGMEIEREGRQQLMEGAPGIRLDNVSFLYPDSDRYVLKNLNFDFKPGTMTAITGATGAGKSTLIKLIMALLKPSEGKVSLYDSVRELESSTDTRCNFMYVPQGNSLMSGTIRQNLLMACPDADEAMLKEALHQAAADFVYDLKNGLDTECSEVGRGLSEGQAQRIAIARALLRPGGILILDECTSALDASTEQEFLESLQKHFHGTKTILCITHRPAATKFADLNLIIGQ